MVPVALTVGTLRRDLVVRRHLQRARRWRPRPSRLRAPSAAAPQTAPAAPQAPAAPRRRRRSRRSSARRRPRWRAASRQRSADAPPEEMTLARRSRRPSRRRARSPRTSTSGSGGWPRSPRCCSPIYFWRMDGEQLEILKELIAVGGAARGAHRRGARGDPVRHLHRHRVGGDRRARRALPGGHGEVPARGLVVESRRRDRRRRARLVRRRDFVELLVSGSLGAHVLGDRRAGAHESAELHRSFGENIKQVDVPHREDDGDGLLAVRRLGALLRRVRAARRPGADRALGARA